MNEIEIRQQLEAIRAAEPGIRARDAALRLGISEGELVSSTPGNTRLRPDFASILGELPALGEVLAITRNEAAVHEKRGIYPAPEPEEGSILVHSRDIDLRVFLHGWASAFAVRDEARGKPRHSLQFFDGAGDAVHKIWLEESSDLAAFERLVERFASPAERLEVRPIEARPNRPDEEIDAAGLRAAWEALTDTHEFFGMLKRFGAGRLQALRLVGGGLAQRVPNAITSALLHHVAAKEVPIMVFVGSRGVIQIHSGPVRRVAAKGGWLNVLDHGFNLHLREDLVAESWIVRKPTADGFVTSLELFDAKGEVIALFFGERKPGIPEAESWRQALAHVERSVS
ncbi:hemin-degrading factor [Vulgatibacter incomptus]|uniref:Hemin transport protein HmuS n=1 Tax=Vulgatibacter incomptus TaxID=1391653 RepID=A0A0K1PBU1_9BACT|nr:hemin-degrading factor [Vulgatibacter incomptus]AKU90967.1 Hemin transport protein HmuS [Vulgatibacter incomptus]